MLMSTNCSRDYPNEGVIFFQVGFASSQASVRDLFAGQDLGVFKDGFSGPVNPTGVRLLKLTPA